MALLDVLLPNAASDVVAVFSNGQNQVFTQARPIKATVDKQAKVMEHPVENGATIIDHRVILPIGIELSMIIAGADYRNVYQEIAQLFRDAELLTVQTRVSTYANMMIEAMPHQEDPEMFDAITLGLKLREVRFVQAQFGVLPRASVRNPANASTQQRGQQQTTAANTTQETQARQSVLYGVFN